MRPSACALLAVGATLGFTTFRRNADYESAATLWEDTSSPKRPGTTFGRISTSAKFILQAGAFNKAVAQYQAADKNFAPNTGRNAEFRDATQDYLGLAFLGSKRLDEAFAWLIADGPRRRPGAGAQKLNDFGFTTLDE